jgi:hypothetical protein
MNLEAPLPSFLDFQRGGEDDSLVLLASTYINNGQMEGFVDPMLLETHSDVSEHERESIMKVGTIAMGRVQMRYKARPTMDEVFFFALEILTL